MKTTVTLSDRQWHELLNVTDNGFGDGDYYGLNHPARFRSPSWRSRLRLYSAARASIARALCKPDQQLPR